MKILCVSDYVDPLIYSLQIKERYKQVELILSAGDLPSEYLGFITTMLNIPLVYVDGNHCIESSESQNGALPANFKCRHESGLLILGLPGSINYNGGPNQYTEMQMRLRILLQLPRLLWNRIFYGRFIDIILAHAAPLGVQDRQDDCHRGFSCFLWLIRFLKPKWFIHGHIHLYDTRETRISILHNTTIINAFGHYILEFGE